MDFDGEIYKTSCSSGFWRYCYSSSWR
jgi:hypothetical protein